MNNLIPILLIISAVGYGLMNIGGSSQSASNSLHLFTFQTPILTSKKNKKV